MKFEKNADGSFLIKLDNQMEVDALVSLVAVGGNFTKHGSYSDGVRIKILNALSGFRDNDFIDSIREMFNF